jgi:D-glycero-alpha-D-manno-heptose-7-phosphate kinase
MRHGGMVVSAAIDKHLYVFLTVTRRAHIEITSSDYQTFYRQPAEDAMLWDGDLSLPRAVLSHFNIHEGLSMFLASQVPPGTGLGSSGTAAVAMIKALTSLLGRGPSKHEIAEIASFIEIEKLGMPIGKQDQFAASFGGINAIRFGPEGVVVEPLRVRAETVQRLERNVLLFYTGAARESRRVLGEQNRSTLAADAGVIAALHALKTMAADARRHLEAGDLEALGELLNHGWEQKKRLASGITNARVDECYETARELGALGGKLTGAGGGGFLMLYCPDGTGARVTAALEAQGLKRMDFAIDFDGAKILVNNALPFSAAVAPNGMGTGRVVPAGGASERHRPVRPQRGSLIP